LKNLLEQLSLKTASGRSKFIIDHIESHSIPYIIEKKPFNMYQSISEEDISEAALIDYTDEQIEQMTENEIQSITNLYKDFSKDSEEIKNIIIDLSQYCNAGKSTAIIFTAHYDVVFGSSGANDNASSIAILLELADHIIQFGSNHPVKIIFFDKEENGGLGSSYHLENTQYNSDSTFINLDVCGCGDFIAFCDMSNTDNNIASSFYKTEIQDKYNLESVLRFPFSDADIISEAGYDVISISVFPESDLEKLRHPENLMFHALDVLDFMHNGKYDDIKYINPDIMNKILYFLIDTV